MLLSRRRALVGAAVVAALALSPLPGPQEAAEPDPEDPL